MIPLEDGDFVTAPQDALSSAYATGDVGYDASWPQCGQPVSDKSSSGVPYRFAVLGVNHTIAFTKNECLAQEYNVASGYGQTIAFYIDVQSPAGASANQGNSGPRGTCTTTDALCLGYNYGYNSAAYSFDYARQTLGDDAVSSAMWWLDVEVGSKPWSKNQAANAQVLQGAIDYFQARGSTVGAYSILWMWNQIAGAGYRPGIPAWPSGVHSVAETSRVCKSVSFTGGLIVVVQQAGKKLDLDYGC
jgi:hypothetical protein